MLLILYYIITIYEDSSRYSISVLPVPKAIMVHEALLSISFNSPRCYRTLRHQHLAVSIVELPWSPQTFDENFRFFRFILPVIFEARTCRRSWKANTNQVNGLRVSLEYLYNSQTSAQPLTQYKNITSIFRLTWTNCMRTWGCCN